VAGKKEKERAKKEPGKKEPGKKAKPAEERGKAKPAEERGKAKPAEERGKAKPAPKPRGPSPYEKRYREECAAVMMKQFGYKNPMQVPRLEKIVINTSIKEALQDIKILQNACDELAAIVGQRPVITKAKKSIANFKLRKGQSVGATVTLRRKRMYEFMNRLVNVALPRVRDFKGVSSHSFDGRGNYTLGLTEQTIFPEINYDKVLRLTGMNITFVTSAKTDQEGKTLLSLMGMPFKEA
jgi:large subunit ribosomal protein L5